MIGGSPGRHNRRSGHPSRARKWLAAARCASRRDRARPSAVRSASARSASARSSASAASSASPRAAASASSASRRSSRGFVAPLLRSVERARCRVGAAAGRGVRRAGLATRRGALTADRARPPRARASARSRSARRSAADGLARGAARRAQLGGARCGCVGDAADARRLAPGRSPDRAVPRFGIRARGARPIVRGRLRARGAAAAGSPAPRPRPSPTWRSSRSRRPPLTCVARGLVQRGRVQGVGHAVHDGRAQLGPVGAQQPAGDRDELVDRRALTLCRRCAARGRPRRPPAARTARRAARRRRRAAPASRRAGCGRAD